MSTVGVVLIVALSALLVGVSAVVAAASWLDARRAVRAARAAVSRLETLEKRVDELDVSVVRGVMEDNAPLADRVLEVHDRIQRTGMSSRDAMREARRLCGLPP